MSVTEAKSGLAWMVDQMRLATENEAAAMSQRRARRARPNPKPPGVIRTGSATDAVLKLLRQTPKRFWCHYEIVEATWRSRVAVDWALIYLRAQGLIECAPDSKRNSKYLRYRAKAQP